MPGVSPLPVPPRLMKHHSGTEGERQFVIFRFNLRFRKISNGEGGVGSAFSKFNHLNCMDKAKKNVSSANGSSEFFPPGHLKRNSNDWRLQNRCGNRVPGFRAKCG